MNYIVEGNGETLLFIHGLSDNLLYWQLLASNLKKDYQVLRVDLRGHGESDLGDDEISVRIFADDLHCLLNELGIGKVNLVGFSLGGAVALDFTVRYPQMVSSIVLMSSFYKSTDFLVDSLNQSRMALESSFEDYYDLMITKALCPDVIENNREELNLIKEFASMTANTDAYIKAIDACLDFDIEDDLCEIDVPALILAGKYDDIIPLDLQINLKNKIGNSKIIVFDNVKHNLLVGKNNAEILKILNEFYKKNKK